MTRIVAAVFDDQPAANAATDALRRLGFGQGDVDEFVLDAPGRHAALPPGGDQDHDPDGQASGGERGALTGAAVGGAIGVIAGALATPVVGPIALAGGLAAGAYAGSLAGALSAMGEDRTDARGAPVAAVRPSGIMLAVNSGIATDEECILDALYDHGARMIERADGEWRDGHWTDFDPVAPPLHVDFETRSP